MSSILSLLSCIFFGDFGLLTLTPRYLFCVLFPVMIFVGFLSAVLSRNKAGRWFPLIIGLGCTTAALASLDTVKENTLRRRLLWILVLLVPCSSQIAIIASFAAIVTLHVFLTYAVFSLLIIIGIYFLLSRIYPLAYSQPQPTDRLTAIRPAAIIKEAFLSVTSTIPSFCTGSVIISIATYCGVLEGISELLAPWMERFLLLPKEAASLFILNLFKRDFGSASLLAFAERGVFDAVELLTVMIMLTFCVPCFNTTVLLFKQEKLPMASLIWMGSLFICLLFGRLVSTIFFVCTV